MLLWRYLTAQAWERLLSDTRLPLTRMAAFEDPFECEVPALLHVANQSKWVELRNMAARARKQFASCWFADEHESIAMWERFVGRDQPGVAIATLAPDLQRSVARDCVLAPVQYVRANDHSALVAVDRAELLPFYKLWGYRQEKEFRLLVPDRSDLVDVPDMRLPWGWLQNSDWRSMLHIVRVFAPNTSASTRMLKQATKEVPKAQVSETTARPKIFIRKADEWWWLGTHYHPEDWFRNTMEVVVNPPSDKTVVSDSDLPEKE